MTKIKIGRGINLVVPKRSAKWAEDGLPISKRTKPVPPKAATAPVEPPTTIDPPKPRKRRRRSKRTKFAPVAREVRRLFRSAELEASRVLTEFLGYPVEVKRKRDKKQIGKPGDTTNPRKMEREARRKAFAGSRDELHQTVTDLFAP